MICIELGFSDKTEPIQYGGRGGDWLIDYKSIPITMETEVPGSAVSNLKSQYAIAVWSWSPQNQQSCPKLASISICMKWLKKTSSLLSKIHTLYYSHWLDAALSLQEEQSAHSHVMSSRSTQNG